jgi:hypothetical protein
MILAIYFRGVVTGRQTLFYRDVLTFHYPIWAATAGDYNDSGLPLWNARIHFGQPILGNPNYLLGYPPAWIRFVLDPLPSFHLFILLHLLAGGLAFYLLAREWGLSPPAGFWGGVFYTFSGVNLSLTCVLNLVPYVALAPLAAWAAIRLVRTRQARWMAVLALILALVITVFEPMMAAGLGVLLLALTAVFRSPAAPGGNRGGGWLRLAAAGCLAVLLASPILWEGVRLAGSADRSDSGGEALRVYSEHPLLSLEMFVPNPLGFSFEDKQSFRGTRFYGSRDPYLVSIYLGAGMLSLLGLALLPPRLPRALFLLGGALLFLALSWGGHLPGLAGLMQRLPLLSWARYPQKFMFYASLLTLLLASTGLDRLLGRDGECLPAGWKAVAATALPILLVLGLTLLVPEFSLRGLLPVAAIAAGIVPFCLLLRARRPAAIRWAGHAAGLLLALDLLISNGFAVPLAPADTLRDPVPMFQALLGPGIRPAAFRVAVEPHPTAARTGRPGALWYMLFLKNAGYPYFGMTQNVHYAFDLLLDKTHSRSMSRLRDEFFQRPLPERVALLQRLGVRYLISLHPYVHPDLRICHVEAVAPGYLFRVYEILGSRGRLDFYVRSRPTPRAVGKEWIDLLAALPADTILADADPGSVSPKESGGGRARLEDVGWSADGVEVRVDSLQAGFLVLRDGYDPGWKAEVDGRPASVRTVDGLFLGVRLPAGAHRVRFHYRPAELPWLSAVSGASLLLILGLWIGNPWSRADSSRPADRQKDHDHGRPQGEDHPEDAPEHRRQEETLGHGPGVG